MVRLASQSVPLSIIVSIEVMIENLIIELVMLSVKLRVGEDASLHQIVCKESSLLQMMEDVWE